MIRTKYPLNMEPTNAEAKKMQALLASSDGVGGRNGYMLENPHLNTLSIYWLGGGRGGHLFQQTFLGVPAPENSVYGRIECAFGQSNLLSNFRPSVSKERQQLP